MAVYVHLWYNKYHPSTPQEVGLFWLRDRTYFSWLLSSGISYHIIFIFLP